MTDTEIQKLVSEFIKEFLPDVVAIRDFYGFAEVEIKLSVGKLIYDFHDDFPDVRFSHQETKRCLEAFLVLSDFVTQLLQTLKLDVHGSDYRGAYLYRLGWLDPCLLLMAHFYRLRQDEDYSELVVYAADVDAVGKVKNLLTIVDPNQSLIGLDSVKCIYTIYMILEELTLPKDSGLDPN